MWGPTEARPARWTRGAQLMWLKFVYTIVSAAGHVVKAVGCPQWVGGKSSGLVRWWQLRLSGSSNPVQLTAAMVAG